MTATYTFDVFTSLDGNASYGPPGDWGGYWGKQGPEFLDHRLVAYEGEQRMLFGATTFGLFLQMLPQMDVPDPWIAGCAAARPPSSHRRCRAPLTGPTRLSPAVTLWRLCAA
jgi:hypothetical protein